uniref:Uncharacterized protein n=1 Tax=viral metagenome TaxID=1070528 RepID=A0A6M3IKN4_9ZZZZ
MGELTGNAVSMFTYPNVPTWSDVMEQTSPDYEKVTNTLLDKYPRLRKERWRVEDASDPKHPYYNPKGFSEYYSPDEEGTDTEPGNPYPGYPTILMRKHSKNPEKALLGEMMHRLAESDEGFRDLRSKVLDARGKRAEVVDQEAYKYYRDPRPYKDFLNYSRHDAYMRALMDPESNPDWDPKEIWGDKEQALREEVENYLLSEPKEEISTKGMYSPQWMNFAR